MKPYLALVAVTALLWTPMPASAKLVHFAHRKHGHHHGRSGGEGDGAGPPAAPPAAPPLSSGPPAPEGW